MSEIAQQSSIATSYRDASSQRASPCLETPPLPRLLVEHLQPGLGPYPPTWADRRRYDRPGGGIWLTVLVADYRACVAAAR
ncbi:MAG: hypothetical protein DME04_11140 [Candidatus Rokuibacteriota bacterium]|nr:MAG: hypothetical protein DME04_11140 [Candidatus Rokubacteria bacterium]